MPILHNRSLNGKLFALTLSSGGTSPGQVGSIAAGTVTASTIPLTYTAASGTAPISYLGYTSQHASGSWTANGGTFSATGGTFSGLSAGANYDLRIVATNSAGSSTTDLTAGVTTTVAATAPSQVGSLAASAPTAFTIPMTYTAASGTAPITYVGYTSPHNANTWAQNTGSFTSGGGSFVGLSPTTSYDLRIVASNSAGSSTTNLLTGTSTTAAPAFTRAANRYDIVPSASVVASGSPVSITVYPNGKWNGETITPSVASGSGSFSPATVAPQSGSSSSLSFTYTPNAVGEHAIAVTNSGALYNPYRALLNVYSAGSGVARNITVAIASGLDPQPRQFDTLFGVANGFSFAGAKGWGSVSINLSAIDGATDGLWIRLYDADSSGASNTVGSGTALHASPVQVYGPVTTTGTKTLLLPASQYLYFADIATDPTFTHPVRLPQRFAVWLGIGTLGRSQEAGFAQWYYDNTAPTGETAKNVLVRYSSDYRYEPQYSGFYRQTGAAQSASHSDGSDPNGPSAGAQAAARIVAQTLGVGVFMVGVMATGGGVDEFINHDGSLSPAFQNTVADAGIDSKFRWMWAASQDGWDNVSSSYTGTFAEYQTRCTAAMDYIVRNYPACAVQGWGGGGTGRPEPNGSAQIVAGKTDSPGPGAARLQNIFMGVEITNPMVVSKDNHAWAAFAGGHGNQSSKRIYTQTGLRQLISAELAVFGGLQTQARGPTLNSTGTIANGSRIIRLPGTLNGGGSLQTVTIAQTNPNYTVAFGGSTASNLASLVAIYPPGGYSGNGQAIKITGIAINTSNLPSGADFTLDVTLYGSSGITYADGSTAAFPSGFSAHYAADLNASGGDGYNVVNTQQQPPPTSVVNMITDSQVSGPWEWGRHLRPKLDIQISVV